MAYTKLFNDLLANVKAEIAKQTDHDLLKADNKSYLLKKHSISDLGLNKQSAKHEIKSERLSWDSAPSGFSFTPGKTYEYIVYTVPFSKGVYMLSYIFQNTTDQRSGLSVNTNGYATYKEYSQIGITGNETEQLRIRDNALKAFASLEATLSQFNQEAQSFNNDQLKSTIDNLVDEEIQKRNNHNKTMDNLKLW